ncbi:hypothetical protein BX616_008117 [Lobosporangium transversale]|uniref:Uncharacterized protein n=1 Tax=Lobosporangium transversale TaxID=64571 RepID=A0A1Y2H267_9FUNG|nr:hypothetical protein BCR41DRAFT_343829 [Lobosporangium transversale]KAF9914532.1 hypothetical protein BX616_008117 [Lobosporangium transversale]ORZ28647.1 hypothetical protein BCR41DRAFT_343829 [Lobosporangium transversale]|eukprot:XP_021886320.1 hypothetical protein BCR41DRAFT_343829 [Lobosporangium transversale]
MGRRLNIFCPCLPRKQRDNLSSRSLYLDQDSSGYSDDDDAYTPAHVHPYHHSRSRSRLEALDSDNYYHDSIDDSINPWPTKFSNSRFSRNANQAGFAKSHSRNHSPFEIPYRDDTDDDDDSHQQQQNQQQQNYPKNGSESNRGANSGKDPIERESGIAMFVPYRDDENDSTNHDDNGISIGSRNTRNSSTKVYPKANYTPYNIHAEMVPSPRKLRAPRNLHDKVAWDDTEDDAEEVLDVDALIAEQERITRELAAQEEALRQEEEAAIVAKRMAAIRAAEKRGLLRFEGDKLVIPSSDKQVQGDDLQISLRHTIEKTTPSTASSFVGGIDAFNLELKMANLNTYQTGSQNKIKMASSSSSVSRSTRPAPTRTSTSTSTATWVSAADTLQPLPPSTTPKTVSISTSTSTSTSGTPITLPGQSGINTRGVLSNITTFLKKVDGVIAGDSGDESSDESSFHKELDNKQEHRSSGISSISKGHVNRLNGLQEPIAKLPINGESSGEIEQDVNSCNSNNIECTRLREYNTCAAEAQPAPITTIAVTAYSGSERQSCPEDPFNNIKATSNEAEEDRRKTSIPWDQNNENIEHDHINIKTDEQERQPEKAHVPAITAITTGTYFGGALSSIFNTGSSIMGYFSGVGAGTDQHQDGYEDEEERKYTGHRLSPFNYIGFKARTAAVTDDDDDDSINDFNF